MNDFDRGWNAALWEVLQAVRRLQPTYEEDFDCLHAKELNAIQRKIDCLWKIPNEDGYKKETKK
jgi:hypothetical protein